MTREPALADEKQKKEMLLTLRAMTPEEVEGARVRIRQNRGSAMDEWVDYRERYLEAYGIKRVDAAFLEEYGVQPTAPKVDLNMCMLRPPWMALGARDRETRDRELRAAHVMDVVEALGFRSQFDVEHRTTLEERMEALLSTRMMKEYDTEIDLFDERAEPPPAEWKLPRLERSLNSVLGAAGLGLKNVGTDRSGRTTYGMCPDLVGRMLELCKLRTMREGVRQKHGVRV
jgi:hypothetical protein